MPRRYRFNPRKLLVICMDGRWRSPLAMHILRQFHGFHVMSAGFEDPGYPMAKQARHALVSIGITPSHHLSELVALDHYEWADEVIMFDEIDLSLWDLFVEVNELRPKRWRFLSPDGQEIDNPTVMESAHDREEVLDRVIIAAHKFARFNLSYLK